MAGRCSVTVKRKPVRKQPVEPGWLLTPEQLPPLKETHVVKQHRMFLKHRGWVIIRIHIGTFVPFRCLMRVIEAFQKHNPVLIQKAIADAKRSCIEMGEEGQSDDLAVHPTFGALWVEYKRPGGKIRPKQLVWFDAITRAYRFRAVITDSIDEFIPWYMKTYDAPNPPDEDKKPEKKKDNVVTLERAA